MEVEEINYLYLYSIKSTTSFPAIPAALKASLPANTTPNINEHKD